MSDSLGTARLDLTVDISGWEAAVGRARNIASGLGDAAEKAFLDSNNATRGASTSLLRYADLIGKSADEVKVLRAMWAGVDTTFLNAAIGRINDARAATAALAQAERDRAAAAQQAAEFAVAGAEADKTNRLKEEARVIAVLTQRFHELEAAEQQLAAFSLAARKQDETNKLREQERVVGVLTQKFHELETAEREALAVQSTKDNFINSLQQQAAAVGKTRSELLEMKAAELGVTQAATPFIAKLREQENALMKTGIQFDKYGLSAKQTQAALRQVPAQMTDIFVSLQGGQAPLTVLLQQGGQLKDVFGGVVPAARALGGAVLGLITPYTLLAAAAGTVAYAFIAAASEQTRFQTALSLSGNRVGKTTDDLEALAIKLDATSSKISQSFASEAISAVARTGKIAGENMELVARAALNMQNATGIAVDQTVAKFAEIAEDPVKALLKLNEAENFLDATTLKRVRSLQEEGRWQEAARVGTIAYANAVNTAATDIEARLGTVERMWREIKKIGGEAKDAILNIGRAQSDVARQAELIRQQESDQSQRDTMNPDGAQYKFITSRMLKRADELKQLSIRISGKQQEQDDKNATAEANRKFALLDQFSEQYKTQQERKQIEIARATQLAGQAEAAAVRAGNKDLAVAIKERLAITLKGIEERYKPRAGSKTDGDANAQTRADLQRVKDAFDKEKALIETGTKELEAQYRAKLIPAEKYYAELRVLAERGTAAEEQSVRAQIAVLQSRDAKGRDSINIQRQIGELEKQLAVIRAKSTSELAVLAINEKAFYDARAEAIQKYKDRLGESNIALREQVNDAVRRIGLTQQEGELQQKLSDIYAEQARRVRELQAQLRNKEIDQAVYDADVAAEQEATDEKVRIVRDGHARMLAAQSDWLTASKTAIRQWMEDARNTTSQVQSIVVRGLDGMTNAISDFATTGKLKFKELLASILSDIVKFLAKKAILQFIQYFFPSLGLGSGNVGAGSISGSPAGLPSGQMYAANGAAFSGEKSHFFAQGAAFRTNAILDRPTPFRFGKGGKFQGVAGEAGPEAIMPLERGSDGKLGVRASGGGASVSLHVETHIHSDGTKQTNTRQSGDDAAAYKEFTATMANTANEMLDRALMPGGKLWKAGIGR